MIIPPPTDLPSILNPFLCVSLNILQPMNLLSM
jgi:hypothetical protein